MRHRDRHSGDARDPGSSSAKSKRPKPLVSAKPVVRKPQPAPKKRGKDKDAKEVPEVRKRSRAARHPVVLALNLVMLVIVMSLIGGVAALVLGRQMYLAEGPLPQDVGVIIDRGASLTAIAQGLEERGIISNRFVFMAVAAGTRASIQAGEYRIPARATMADVMDRVQSGRVVQHQITIPEGLTSTQVVRRLENNDVLTGTIDVIPPEGSLLPETYQFNRGMTRQRLLDLMSAEMDAVVTRLWENRDPTVPLETPADLVTLASIVEKETGVAGERARVAGVFTNRLRQRMRLQSDPTILYGLYGGDAWAEARTIYRSDLQRPNRYNTYQIPALPPGPIANPGRAALEASANPADTNELFFVADGTGGHAFAVTYEEHQRNVAAWRAIERQRAQGTTQ